MVGDFGLKFRCTGHGAGTPTSVPDPSFCLRGFKFILAYWLTREERSQFGWKMTESSLDLQESGWEELRREARKLEGDLDVKLSSYAKLGARFTQGGSFPASCVLVMLIVIFHSL